MRNGNYNKRIIDDNNSFKMKNLIIILIVIAVVLVGFYFLTKYVIENKKDEDSITEAVIQKDKIIFGQLFDRKESEYYVLAYKSNSKSKSLYDKYINEYNEGEGKIKFYEINMDEAFNRNFVDDEENITDDIKNLKVNDETLFKIKDQKIEEYKIGSNQINSYLKELVNMH